MPTPSTQIGFSDLNVEILQQASTTQTDLNTSGIRLGYGSTAQVSISQLRKAYGATVTCGGPTTIGKGVVATGYYSPSSLSNFNFGSVDDEVIDAGSANTRLRRAFSTIVGGTPSSTALVWISTLNDTLYANGSVQRVAIGGTAYTPQTTSGPSPAAPTWQGQQKNDYLVQFAASQYAFPSTGTVTVGIKWS